MGWIIAGAVIAFFAVLVCLPIVVHIRYDEQFSCQIRYLFLKYNIPIATEGQPVKPKKKKKRKKKKQPPEPQPKGFSLARLKQTASILKDLLEAAWEPVKRIGKRVIVAYFDLDLRVATGDAAETAIQYGNVCAGVYGVLAALHNFMRFEKTRIQILPDFEHDAYRARFFCKIKIPVYILLLAGPQFLFRFLKRLFVRTMQRKKAEAAREASPAPQAEKEPEAAMKS